MSLFPKKKWIFPLSRNLIWKKIVLKVIPMILFLCAVIIVV